MEPKWGHAPLTELRAPGSLCSHRQEALKQQRNARGTGFGTGPAVRTRAFTTRLRQSLWYSEKHSPSWESKASELDTYKHLDGDRHGAVERRVASILGHDCEVDQPIGYLFIIQWAAHADHWNSRSEDLNKQSSGTLRQRFPRVEAAWRASRAFYLVY